MHQLMTLPNILTGIRFLMIPLVFTLGAVVPRMPYMTYVFVVLFPLMSVAAGAVMFKLAGRALRRYIF